MKYRQVVSDALKTMTEPDDIPVEPYDEGESQVVQGEVPFSGALEKGNVDNGGQLGVKEGAKTGDVEVPYQQDQNPGVAMFKDHFTLPLPSSTIRYRESRSAARVVEGQAAQFVLEETYDKDTETHQVEIRMIEDTPPGVQFLRITYVIVTAFWTGFLFIFCLQILLFLALDMAVQLGITSKDGDSVGRAIGSILGFPAFIYGLTSALVLAGAFIADTWRGHPLIRNFTFRNLDSVVVEWIFFFFFIGFPIFIMCVSLLSGTDDWWAITLLYWFASIVAFYVIFAFNVIWYEMHATWMVTKHRYRTDDDSWSQLIRRSILLRQVHAYSGVKTISYLSRGSIIDSEYADRQRLPGRESNVIGETVTETIAFYSKQTKREIFSTDGGRFGIFRDVSEMGERLYSIDDARDVRPFLTYHTWGLEKVFCRDRNSRFIAIVKGPGALTKGQLRSSLLCSVLGTFLILFVILSVLVYLQLGSIGTGFGVAIGVLWLYPSLSSTYRLSKTSKDLILSSKEDAQSDKKESEGVYYAEEKYRITKPTERFCWIMFATEVTFFFLYPVISLFSSGNYPLGTMFAVFVGISLLRYYVNAAVVLEETGHMNLVGTESTEESRWRKQSRLNVIVGNITRGKTRYAWMSVLGFVGFAFLALMLGAVGTDQETNDSTPPTTFLYDFEYIQADSFRYPTCQLSIDLGAAPLVTMADYAFLAGLAYRGVNGTQAELDGWFKNLNGTVTDNPVVVEEFRAKDETPSAVSFKLVTVSRNGKNSKPYAYVLIRGTTNNWDMLTDAQLWSAAALFQMHRELLPMGSMWTSIMDELIKAINKIESENIAKVAFYTDTGAFVDFLLNQTGDGPEYSYSGVAVTGHSLGGGLSIITGAQKGISAVALSGPNAKLSGRSFNPPLTTEQLDRHTFNIIPARDVVPMIDDRASNFQEIRCQASFADIIGCHNSIRSLCEIIYTCGSQNRPVPCTCARDFKFPKPTPKEGTTRTFEEACGIETTESTQEPSAESTGQSSVQDTD